MIDPKVLRDDPDRVRAALAKRGLSDEVVSRSLEADVARRAAIAAFEEKRAEQKQLGALIPKAGPEEKQELLARTKTLAAEVKEAEAARVAADETWDAALVDWLDVQQKRHVVITFGGGVNEVMRDMIATAGLGLPRVKR